MPGAGSYRVVFLVGAARSGTTWLQLLLAQHPEVATSQETRLFDCYLSRIEDRWLQERAARENGIRTTGLTDVLSEEEFYEFCRDFARQVLDAVRRGKPGATVVLEKSPDHAHFGRLILRLFPEAAFLHIVRDPRAVANSFRHAGKTWWRQAGPATGPVGAARLWRASVESARDISPLTPRYLELRYEDLHEKGPRELLRIFRWLELPADPELCRGAFRRCAIDKLRAGRSPAPHPPWSLEGEAEGFFRRGEAEAWRHEMPTGHLRVVEHVTADLMDALGYPREHRTALRPARLLFHRLLGLIRRGGAGLAASATRGRKSI